MEAQQALTTTRLADGAAVLAGRDRRLGCALARNGVPPLWGRPQGFETLFRIILEQQVSLSAAQTLFDRLKAGLGGITPTTIIAAAERGLRARGVTRQKASYCVGLAKLIQDRRLSLSEFRSLDDDSVWDSLTAVRGIGPWTAGVYLLMALRRPDVWPTGDLALLNSAQQVLRLRGTLDQGRLDRIALRWKPFRSIAARILWHDYLRRAGRSASGPSLPALAERTAA